MLCLFKEFILLVISFTIICNFHSYHSRNYSFILKTFTFYIHVPLTTFVFQLFLPNEIESNRIGNSVHTGHLVSASLHSRVHQLCTRHSLQNFLNRFFHAVFRAFVCAELVRELVKVFTLKSELVSPIFRNLLFCSILFLSKSFVDCFLLWTSFNIGNCVSF